VWVLGQRRRQDKNGAKMDKRNQRWKFLKESKKTRKHAFDQESDQEKKERKHPLDQESDQEKKTKTITVKKKKK